MPVLFPLEAGKPPVLFKFTVGSCLALERVAGMNPAQLAVSGSQTLAMVLMLQFARTHEDPTMNERKAIKLIDKYHANGGRSKALMDALAKALNESGIYGDPDEIAGDVGGEDDDEDPTTPTLTPSS